MSDPSFCNIGQGSKEILLGDNRYWDDSAHYLIATTALPIANWIAEALEEQPFLSVMVALDPALISAVMSETGYLVARSQSAVTAIDVSALDTGLLDAVVRLVRLLDSLSDALPGTAPPRTALLKPSTRSGKTSTGRYESRSSRTNWE